MDSSQMLSQGMAIGERSCARAAGNRALYTRIPTTVEFGKMRLPLPQSGKRLRRIYSAAAVALVRFTAMDSFLIVIAVFFKRESLHAPVNFARVDPFRQRLSNLADVDVSLEVVLPKI